MKTIFSALLFFGLSASAQQANYDTSILKEQIKKLDLAHARAIFMGDAVSLDTLMSDDVTVNHPTNRIVKEKEELLALIKKGVIRYTAFERIPETFLFFAGMVVVMGSEKVTPAAGAPGAGKQLQRRYTNTWMNQNGRWQLRVRHANNVCATL